MLMHIHTLALTFVSLVFILQLDASRLFLNPDLYRNTRREGRRGKCVT